MGEITIIGGGFSALSARLLSMKSSVITPKNEEVLSSNGFLKRRQLETNKICGPKAYSFGTIEVKINEAKLHDRLSLGGNSRIWGGLIDTSEIPSQVINKFKLHGIEFIKLSYSRTGSISNNSNIYQISKQDCILDTKNELNDFINGYLVSFFIKGNKIGLNILTASNNNKIIKKTIFTRKLILCAGVIQTVDLLYRSKFIKNGDKITLDEFSYDLKYKFSVSSSLFNKTNNNTVVKYTLSSALSHFLGFQKKIKCAFLFDWIPFYIEQYFLDQNNSHEFTVNDSVLKDFSFPKKRRKKLFGRSIHYCNMNINNISINELLKKISPNIYGIGMAFTKQKKPGPISNDIILAAYKINKFN